MTDQNKHAIGTRDEWLAARLELLDAEKKLTRQSDAVAKQRQELPWVAINKEYEFETPDGRTDLAGLFGGRSQLIVYHFMFAPDEDVACPACSAIADGFDGFQIHLANHDVALLAVSRAPLATLQQYKQRMGWTFPWASSLDGAFSFDFNASFTQEQRQNGIEYNYRRATPVPTAPAKSIDRPGMSAFALEDGIVYHTYSTYSRGLDALWGMYQWLDRAPKGRNESGMWFRRKFEYDKR